jgi:hypothetical protein
MGIFEAAEQKTHIFSALGSLDFYFCSKYLRLSIYKEKGYFGS